MNLPWSGLLCAALGFGAFLATHHFAHPHPARQRLAALAILLPLALPGATFTLYYFHLVPEPAWFYELRSWRMPELFLVPLGAFGGVAATFIPKRLRLLPLLGTLSFLLVPFLKPILGPLDADILEDRWKNGVCLQSMASTCGAASTATILTRHGFPTSEREIAVEAYTYVGGTEAWYLARALRRRGFGVRFRTNAALSEISAPAIAGTMVGSAGHFVPLLERLPDENVVFGDPLYGWQELPPDRVAKVFDLTGWFLEITPPSGK